MVATAPETVDYALLPYQQRWFADPSPVKLYTKSRRIGISWTEASGCAMTAARVDGMSTTYICYDKDITRQFIRDCADWAKLYSLAASEIDERQEVWKDGDQDKSVLIFEIRFASGFDIQAIAGTPRKLRGRKGRVVIDEAAFLDNFAETLEAALALLIWGGEIHIITTYNGLEEPYYELEQDVLAGKLPYSRHFTTFDDAIREGLYQRICQVGGKLWSPEAQVEFVEQTRAFFGDRASQELDCIPKGGGGKYFLLAVLERALCLDGPTLVYACKTEFAAEPEEVRIRATQEWLQTQVEPILNRLDPNLLSFFGMDFARNGDVSVIIPLQQQPDLTKQCPFAIELCNVPFEQQRQILWFLIQHLPRFMFGAIDATGNGAHLAEVTWQKFGEHRIERVTLNRKFYQEKFPRYRTDLEEGQVLLLKSADWKADHRLVELDKGVPVMPDVTIKGADGRKRHGDSAVAGLLANYATTVEYLPEPDFYPIEEPALELDDWVNGTLPLNEVMLSWL